MLCLYTFSLLTEEYFSCLQFRAAFKRIFKKSKSNSRKGALRKNEFGIQDRKKVESFCTRKRKKSPLLKRRPVQCFSKSVKEIKNDQNFCNNKINNEKSSSSETKLRFTANMHKISSQNGIMTSVDIHKDKQGKIEYYTHINKHCFWVLILSNQQDSWFHYVQIDPRIYSGVPNSQTVQNKGLSFRFKK